MTRKSWYFNVEGLKGRRDHVGEFVGSPGNKTYAAESLAGICFLPFRLALYPLIWCVVVIYMCLRILCVGGMAPLDTCFGYWQLLIFVLHDYMRTGGRAELSHMV